MQMKVTSEQAKQLLTDQLSVWESARDNYKALEAVQVKELTVEGCTVKIQFNPARIVSSAAKVDTQSLNVFCVPKTVRKCKKDYPMAAIHG